MIKTLSPLDTWRLDSARGLNGKYTLPTVEEYNEAVRRGELKNSIPIGGEHDRLPEVKARANGGEKVNINTGNENSVTRSTSLKPFADETPAPLNAGGKKIKKPRPTIARAAKAKKSAPIKKVTKTKNTKKAVPAPTKKKAAAPKKKVAAKAKPAPKAKAKPAKTKKPAAKKAK